MKPLQTSDDVLRRLRSLRMKVGNPIGRTGNDMFRATEELFTAMVNDQIVIMARLNHLARHMDLIDDEDNSDLRKRLCE